jgi:hypothetical protein
MRGPDVDSLFRFGLDPSAKDAAARKHERVRPVCVDDGELKIAIERRDRYRLPIHE